MAGREAAGEEEAGDSWPGWPVWFFFFFFLSRDPRGDGRTFQIGRASNADVLRRGGGGGGHIWAGN